MLAPPWGGDVMSLAAGTRLGPYEVVSPLGAGGMGEVYRARDTRLGREVAIKVLPGILSSRPEMRERLDREARALSSLSHPNICVLHDVGHENGTDYVVMELLEGDTLADRLVRGPIPPAQLLEIAKQVADALDRAHRAGIVHRDLKPSNIMLTKAGAKLLDFGLAKSASAVAANAAVVTMTNSKPLTAEGTIVGTFQYMSPEQVEGRDADARSDIFAFGAVLYEMATGKRAFDGKTQASIIAAILASEPKPISELEPMSPPALNRLVCTCLEKDPDERFQSAHDLKLQLQWIVEGGSQAGVPAPIATKRRSRERVAWIAATVLLVGAAVLGFEYWRATSSPIHLWHSYLLPPEKHVFGVASLGGGQAAVSPNGRMVTYVLTGPDGQLLWVQKLDSAKPVPLAGTDGASYPFWSPNSRSIGFFAGAKLKRIDSNGGPVQTICAAADGRGGSWNGDGTIIFSPGPSNALLMVSADGGTPQEITKLNNARNETSHRWPWFLPDGRHFLFTTRAFLSEDQGLYVGSLDSPEHKLLLPLSSNAVYVPPGYLLFMREGSLMGQRFDARRLQLEGEAFPVAENVSFSANYSLGTFSASSNGVLVYIHGQSSQVNWQINWYDRNGKPAGDAVLDGNGPRLSPDGKMLAFQVPSSGGNVTVWLLDVARKVKTRFSFGKPLSFGPVWSPDGKQIAFGTYVSAVNGGGIYVKPSNGSSSERLLLDGQVWPDAWSHDGRYLLMRKVGSDGLPQLWALPMQGNQKPFPVVQIPSYHVMWGDFSPDGKWITYESDESGTSQVYAAPFPGPGGRWQVSTDGGTQPLWRQKEIFFLKDGKVWAAEVEEKGSGLQLGRAQLLFSAPVQGNPAHWYDVSRDGKRFVINVATQPPEANQPLSLVVNWTAGLKK